MPSGSCCTSMGLLPAQNRKQSFDANWLSNINIGQLTRQWTKKKLSAFFWGAHNSLKSCSCSVIVCVSRNFLWPLSSMFLLLTSPFHPHPIARSSNLVSEIITDYLAVTSTRKKPLLRTSCSWCHCKTFLIAIRSQMQWNCSLESLETRMWHSCFPFPIWSSGSALVLNY